MDYAAWLKRTWEITWKYKILWLFGLFTGCSGQTFQTNFSRTSNTTQYQFTSGEFPQLDQFFQQYGEEIAVGLGVFLLCMCFLMLAFWVIGTLAQGGLIAGFSIGQDGGEVNFKIVWDQGVRFFWRILVINLLPLAATLLAGLLVIFSFGLCIIPLICLAIPIALVVAVLVKLATNAVVLEDLTIGEAVEKAWMIMQTRLGELLVVGLLLVVVGFLASLIIGAPFLVTAAPYITGMVMGSQQAIRTGATFLIVCGALYIPVMIVLNAILSTYTNGAWTLAYRRWAGIDS